MILISWDPFKSVYDFFNWLGQQIHSFLVPPEVQIVSGPIPPELQTIIGKPTPPSMGLFYPDHFVIDSSPSGPREIDINTQINMLQQSMLNFLQLFTGIFPLTIAIPLVTTITTEVASIATEITAPE